MIDPEWIQEFFQDEEQQVSGTLYENSRESIYIDGDFSPEALADFLNKKLEDKHDRS